DAILQTLRIEQASDEELIEMAAIRGIAESDPASLRQALYDYHQITHEEFPNASTETDSYRLEIEQARIMESDASSSLVRLQGDVVVSFVGEGTETPKKLMAQQVLIDLEHTLLIASGSVQYQDAENEAALQSIQGSIVSFNWKEDTLTISGATTKSERENSEDEQLNIYTSGSLITYQGENGSILYEEGQLGTREEDPLSSIRADRLSFLSGGDLMVHDASLYMGRVPVFWTPFFFFPGNQMVGNPAMGFTSDRGMFVSTTWEVYGTYPHFEEGEQSSLAKLLSTPSEGKSVPGSVLYEQSEEPSSLQSWAEEHDSYLTFFFDAYEYSGLHGGYDSKTTFFEKRLIFESLSAFGLYPPGKTTLSSYGDARRYRYYANHTVSLKLGWGSLEASMPLYSDPKVLRLYGNRLTSFAFDAVLGKSQEFPTTYKSDITSYTWKLKGSFSFPSEHLSPYISSLQLSNIESDALFKWQNDGSEYGYLLQQLHFPLISASMKGTLLDLSGQIGEQRPPSSAKKEEDREETEAIEEDLLLPLSYEIEQKNIIQQSLDGKRMLSLSYTIDQRITHTLDANLGVIEWDDAYLYSLLKGSLQFKASPNTNIVTISSDLLPQYSYLEDPSKTVYRSESWQLFSIHTATIPKIGLTYTLSQRLYRLQRDYTVPIGTPSETTVYKYAFDEDSVTVHQLRYQQSYELGKGSLTPGVSANLYPLKQRLQGSLNYSWASLSLSSSLLFSEQDSTLQRDTLSSKVSYRSDPLSITLSQDYDFTRVVSSWEDAITINGTFTQKPFSTFLTLSERFSFSFLSDSSVRNYYEHITLDAAIPYLKMSYVTKGEASNLQSEKLQVDVQGKDIEIRWWKRRIAISLGIDSTLKFFFQDRYASSFSIAASLRFQVAEFLDVTFSAKSTNSGFFNYYEGDSFSFVLLWEDLIQSFDFLGDGRHNTQFNLSELSLTLVHDLEDWSLNCKYSGSVVLSNNQYSWVPTVSVYLTWNTIPELDVEETWTQNNSTWTRSSSS
ncbi:MAG: hypothetical protein AB7D92_03220, partial [Sphaerochaeta sp.]